MSTEPATEAAFMQDNPSKLEHSDSHSALFYLFHEVSKLAAPNHSSLLDTNPPFKKPNEVSNNTCVTEKEEQATCSSLADPLVVKDGAAHLFQSSCGSHRHSLCCMIPFDHMKNVIEEGHSSNASTLCDPHGEWNSPWKVLSLINLHCERLLHQKDVEEPGFSLGFSSSRVRHLNATFKTAAPGVTKGGITEDGLDSTSGPSLQPCEGQRYPASACTVEDLKVGSPEEVVPDAGEGCSGQMRTTEKMAPLTIALYKCGSAVTLQPPQGYREKSTVAKHLELIQECKRDCFFTEKGHLNIPLPENALQQMHTPGICSNAKLTFSPAYMECIDLSKPALALDHNGNVTLSTKQPCNAQLPPASADQLSSQLGSFLLNTAGSHQSSSGQYKTFSASKFECCPTTQDQNHPAASSSCNFSSATSSEFWRVRNGEKDQLSTNKCKTRTRRKQPHPSRSADIQDSDFQGVAFRIATELDDNREQCRLLITSKYSKGLCKTERKPKLRTRTSQKSAKTSSSDEENDHTTNINKGKVCASCCTRKTPMWRDAEDGTPLCNACGIRYKKYRVRCVKCWHIPRKEGNSNSLCIRCGNFVKLTSAQRKHPC
ncbi:hypothetical protein CRENBAI_013027 [Crenichthys baileyi]|uniref:GATA-type domain-containing protein n=1 Tax=Crenichthys baileyi TaxID=28760 RepID=A0AAV9SQ54_9TELE